MIGIDIEMPNNCENCRFCTPKFNVTDYGYFGKCTLQDDKTVNLYNSVRPTECPLVEKPVHGKWIWKDSKTYKCSICGHFPWRIITEEGDEVFTDLSRTNAYRYCPTCGAKMESQKGSE